MTTTVDAPARLTGSGTDEVAVDSPTVSRVHRLRQRAAAASHSAPVRAARGQTFTGPGGLVVAVLLLLPGLVLDRLTDGNLGRPTAIAFLLASAVPALLVRRQTLATAAVAPPLLFASAVLLLAWSSGQNSTSRQVVLDAGTTLALAAPTLYAGTVTALVLVGSRLAWSLVHPTGERGRR